MPLSPSGKTLAPAHMVKFADKQESVLEPDDEPCEFLIMDAEHLRFQILTPKP